MNIDECETCIKRKTMYCPNSRKCLNTENKPYYKNRTMILKENEELKKELEELRIHNPNYTPVVTLKKTIKTLYKEQEILRNQQKEFIKYLEDEIKHLEHSRYVSFNEFGEHKLMFYREILSKYKEIIGGAEDD